MSLVASVAGLGLIFGLFLMLVPVALLVVLQVWLCRKGKRLGLILPALSLLLSLLIAGSMAAFSMVNAAGSGVTIGLDENGEVVERQVSEGGMITVYDGDGNIVDQYPDPNPQSPQPPAVTAVTVASVVLLFLAANIPTVVFLGIWLHYKNRRDFQEDLKKMKIEDLE